MDTGLLIARPSRGFAIGVHAVQKLLGWLGGEGLKGTGGDLGFWPGVLFALAAGGGLLTAAGFLGAVGPALIILVMLVAIFTVHWGHGSFAASYGYRRALAVPDCGPPAGRRGPRPICPRRAPRARDRPSPREGVSGDRGRRGGVRVPRATPGGARTSPDVCLTARGSGTS